VKAAADLVLRLQGGIEIRAQCLVPLIAPDRIVADFRALQPTSRSPLRFRLQRWQAEAHFQSIFCTALKGTPTLLLGCCGIKG
jgi:hypothetical protein